MTDKPIVGAPSARAGATRTSDLDMINGILQGALAPARQ
ncbi:hypothetical protein HMPREF1211_00047 [Streptomyces sp. HGB0020]|jgi:hypothetical protein|nr:hypothetical protein HMPREF1211_00047 [Streptomyces sp. HGB0020]